MYQMYPDVYKNVTSLLSSFSLALSLGLASTAILGSWSRGTYGHTFMSHGSGSRAAEPSLSSENC